MALPDFGAVSVGTPIVFANTTHAPLAVNNLGTRTHQLNLTGIAAGAARQSPKVDLGATWDEMQIVMAAIEFATAPAAGETVSFYWANSPDATAANANPGGISGSDAAYTGYSANLADSLNQLQFVGLLVATVQATTTVQIAKVGAFAPLFRYGSLVVYNESAADAFVADAVEMSVLVQPARFSIVDV